MPSGFHNWSHTAATNGSADSVINYSEGQSPSSVNDSARALMAVLAKWRDDISGAIVTGGSSTAFTVTTYTGFSTLALLNGQVIAFTPHATNGATVTLNCDGLGAKPLRAFPGVELQSNVLIAGTPYVAIYNSSSQVFYLQGNAGGTYGIPLGAGMDYWGTTAPSSAFVFPYGQAISRTTYATAFSLFGTTFGVGDGSTTFNVPDIRGRVTAGKGDMGGVDAGLLSVAGFGAAGTTLGATGGGQSVSLVAANIPAGVPSSASNNITVNFGGYLSLSNNVQATVPVPSTGSLYSIYTPSGSGDWLLNRTASSATANSISVTSTNASQTSPRTVQPTIICNKILRVL